MWYVVSMDDIITIERTYREARQYAIGAADDGRKRPSIKRIKSELYTYEQSTRYPTSHRKSWMIGTKEALVAYGVDFDSLGS